MALGPREQAEVRRMASQKVAAELVKGFAIKNDKDPRTKEQFFQELVNFLDNDVVLAGQRAIDELQEREKLASEQKSNGRAEPQAENNPTKLLDDLQQKKMLDFLNKYVVELTSETDEAFGMVSKSSFALMLWTLEIKDTVPHSALVKMLTLEQGMRIYGLVNEALNYTPDSAA